MKCRIPPADEDVDRRISNSHWIDQGNRKSRLGISQRFRSAITSSQEFYPSWKSAFGILKPRYSQRLFWLVPGAMAITIPQHIALLFSVPILFKLAMAIAIARSYTKLSETKVECFCIVRRECEWSEVVIWAKEPYGTLLLMKSIRFFGPIDCWLNPEDQQLIYDFLEQRIGPESNGDWTWKLPHRR